jgi:hypothetical protein
MCHLQIADFYWSLSSIWQQGKRSNKWRREVWGWENPWLGMTRGPSECTVFTYTAEKPSRFWGCHLWSEYTLACPGTFYPVYMQCFLTCFHRKSVPDQWAELFPILKHVTTPICILQKNLRKSPNNNVGRKLLPPLPPAQYVHRGRIENQLLSNRQDQDTVRTFLSSKHQCLL